MQTSFILSKQEGRLSKPYIVLGMPIHLKVSGSDTNGQLSVFVSEHNKNQGPPLHIHDSDETCYVIEGEFIFQMGDTKVSAVPGDILFVPRNMPHAFLATSQKGSLVCILNPAGNVEKLFEKLSLYHEMPPVEEITRVHEELGLKIVGPPLFAATSVRTQPPLNSTTKTK